MPGGDVEAYINAKAKILNERKISLKGPGDDHEMNDDFMNHSNDTSQHDRKCSLDFEESKEIMSKHSTV